LNKLFSFFLVSLIASSLYGNLVLQSQKKNLGQIALRAKERLVQQKDDLNVLRTFSRSEVLKSFDKKNSLPLLIRNLAHQHHLKKVQIHCKEFQKKSKESSEFLFTRTDFSIHFFCAKEKNFLDFISKIQKNKNFLTKTHLLWIQKFCYKNLKGFALKGTFYFSCYEIKTYP
jgi:hypothetical protein